MINKTRNELFELLYKFQRIILIVERKTPVQVFIKSKYAVKKRASKARINDLHAKIKLLTFYCVHRVKAHFAQIAQNEIMTCMRRKVVIAIQ